MRIDLSIPFGRLLNGSETFKKKRFILMFRVQVVRI